MLLRQAHTTASHCSISWPSPTAVSLTERNKKWASWSMYVMTFHAMHIGATYAPLISGAAHTACAGGSVASHSK